MAPTQLESFALEVRRAARLSLAEHPFLREDVFTYVLGVFEGFGEPPSNFCQVYDLAWAGVDSTRLALSNMGWFYEGN